MVKNNLPAFLFGIFVTVLLFYQTFFLGKLPFPGDLLVSEYSPWKFSQFLGYNPGSFPNKAQYFDVILQLYPWRSLSLDLIRVFEPPLWNPYNFSGTPLLANLQSAPFNPLNILFIILPDQFAWSLQVILQPIIAVLGMYLFARAVQFGRLPSIFSAISYGLCLYMSVFLEYNTIGQIIAVLPFIFFAIEKYAQDKRLRFLLILLCALSFVFFAGHLQVAVIAYFFSVFFALWRFRKHGLKLQKVAVATVFVISLLISAVQLIPGFELISNSARVSQSYDFLVQKLLFQPYQLVMFFVPDVFGNPATRNFLSGETYPTKAAYIGAVPLLFAFIGIWNSGRNRYAFFFSFFVLLSFVFLTRNLFSEIFYRLEIPLISSSSPSNAWFIFSFSAAFLAGYGMDIFIKRGYRMREIIAFVSLVIAAALSAFFLMGDNVYIKQALLPSLAIFIALFGMLLTRKFKKISSYLCMFLILLTVFDLFYLFQKFNPFSPVESFYPSLKITEQIERIAGYNRIVGIGNAQIAPNLETELRVFSPNGYDPLYPRSYAEFVYSYQKTSLFTDFSSSSRSNATFGEMFGDGSLMENPTRLRLMDVMGVRYILDRVENGNTQKSFPPERFKPVYSGEGWLIYENLSALPRGYVVYKSETAKTNDEFNKIFYASNFDPENTVILDKDVDLPIGTGSAQVKTLSYSENSSSFSVDTDQEGIFVLNDNNFPGWRVKVDGQEAILMTANHTFRGVFVPKGQHEILFFYDPASFKLGMYISIIGIALSFATFFYLKRR